MTRLALAVTLAALLCGLTGDTKAGGRFDSKLSPDRQIVQVLNRLTFGPRPGDVEEVRRMGVDKWVDLQLHPERIPENPVLDEKLKPLETLRMEPGEIMAAYPQVPPALMFRQVPLNELLPQDQVRRIINGTPDERTAALGSLDPDKRKQVLAVIAPQQLAGMPELQKEAEAARQDQQAERQKQIRKLMPPLNDLLTQDQIQTALRGNSEQLTELFSFLDPGQAAAGGRGASSAEARAVSRVPADGTEIPAAATGGQRRSEGRQGVPGAVFEPATGRSAGRFLVQPLQCVREQERADQPPGRGAHAAGEL